MIQMLTHIYIGCVHKHTRTFRFGEHRARGIVLYHFTIMDSNLNLLFKMEPIGSSYNVIPESLELLFL